MSFIDPNAFYEESLLLLDKNEETPTTITEGQVINGDLTPFRHRMEAVNTGNQLQNNGILVLRIPPDGTFVRKEPILIDESAKDDYIIQFQMKQDKNKDGVFEEEGKLFRFFIGQPTIQDDEFVGETLKINLIPVEYRTRETLDAERVQQLNDKRDPFLSSKGAFTRRAIAYNDIKGTDNTQLIFGTEGNPPDTILLPDNPLLEWRPLAPTSTHDLFRTITERQSLAGVEGGVFTDFFFDYDAFPLSTKAVTIKVEEEGTVDRGVVLDPLTFETSDTQKDNTINVDLIKFKNNVIAQGSPQGGSLPREHTVFSSLFEHGKLREDWDPTRDYGSGGTGSITEPNQSEVRITDTVLEEIRFFKAIDDSGPSSGGAVNPLDAPNRSAKWTEDFVTIPEYSEFASYNEDDVVTETINGDVKFFKADVDIDVDQGEPSTNADWDVTLRSFPEGFNHELFDGATATGLNRAGRTKFFSYTPWTSDFEACRVSCLFGDEDVFAKANFTEADYQGVVPDWNYIRAVYDRVESDNRFEIPVGKDVQKRINSPSDIKQGDRHFGNRFLINANASGFLSTHRNQIAEYIGKVDFATNVDEEDLAFSRDPEEGETVIDRSTGIWLEFRDSTNDWGDLWNVLRNGTGGSVDETLYQRLFNTVLTGLFTPISLSPVGIAVQLLHDTETFGDTTIHSPLHICKDIKLVEGSTGVPGQAIEMRYDWSAIEKISGIEIPNADKRNFSSIGAWWFMMFPYPKIEGFGREVGDVYKNPYIDSNNLDRNSKGVFGWNEGLDSEDLGRLQRISFKVRLSLRGSVTGELVIGYADMPMKFWAVDVFDRVWYADFKIRRNGQYNVVQLSVGENSIQQIHKGRYDELLQIFNIVLDTSFALDEKEWTGIEFDWRFVKAMGMFYNVGYNPQGLYVAPQFPDFVKNIAEQAFGQAFGLIVSLASTQEDYQPTDLLVNNARLAVDELHFEKQAYANSDRAPISDARTVLDHLAQEVDYINLSIRAQATQGRRKFVEQAWYMQAHGDVRLRFGEKFVAQGLRVPGGTQDLICKEVKHIVDSDGYMMQITGKRKFIFGE
jgi:hypothetical protein